MRHRRHNILTILLIGLQLIAVTLCVLADDDATAPASTTTSKPDEDHLLMGSTEAPKGDSRAATPDGGQERGELPSVDETPNKLGISETTVESEPAKGTEQKKDESSDSGKGRSSEIAAAEGDSRTGGLDLGGLISMGQQAMPLLQQAMEMGGSLMEAVGGDDDDDDGDDDSGGGGKGKGKKKSKGKGKKKRKKPKDEEEDEDDDGERSGLDDDEGSRSADAFADDTEAEADSRSGDAEAGADSRAADTDTDADSRASVSAAADDEDD